MFRKVTLSPGLVPPPMIDIDEVKIPDLWHLHQFMLAKKGCIPGTRTKWKDAGEWIRDTWHAAHALKRHIQDYKIDASDWVGRTAPHPAPTRGLRTRST